MLHNVMPGTSASAIEVAGMAALAIRGGGFLELIASLIAMPAAWIAFA